jgi:ABC-type Zn uptake system ZnuABC Zn-binding protein ZnuA
MKTKTFAAFLSWALLFAVAVPAGFPDGEKIKIVATTSTLASIAGEITGEKAKIDFIAAPNRDVHSIAPTPRDIMKLKNADIFIHAGLDLEAWRGPLLDAVGRLDLMWPTGERQIDVSKGISLLEVPDSLSRAQGDIHAYGNPHYWTDPLNAKVIAGNIAKSLAAIYPGESTYFDQNLRAFNERIDQKMEEWKQVAAVFRGQWLIVYHNSFPYFFERFGLQLAGTIEPKPGIPPTAKHLAELIRLMKEKKAGVIIREPFEESRSPRKLAEQTGARVLTLSQSVGEPRGASDYFLLMDYNLRTLRETFEAAKEAAQ